MSRIDNNWCDATHCQDPQGRILTGASAEEITFDERVECKKIDALTELEGGKTDLELGKKSYDRFIRGRRKRNFIRYAAYTVSSVAILACVAIGAWSFANKDIPALQTEPHVSVIRTSAPAGNIAVVDLPDGSQVKLNAGSYIEYPSSFSQTRQVKVNGEAFFSVAHDAEHPFVVSTGKLDIKVLGTRFNVSNYDDKKLAVTLLEGSVVAYSPCAPDDAVTLKPNESLVETNGNYEIRKATEDALTWVDGYYTFKNETFGQIADKLENYYGCKVVITDPSLLDFHFTGKFIHNDGIIEILNLLKKVHDFDFNRDIDTNTIYINPKRR